MTKDEALKMAIEHIEHNGATTERKMVLQACKKALEQPEQYDLIQGEPLDADDDGLYYVPKQPAQEPVAWMHRHAGEITEFNDFQSCQYCEPLYTHPAPSWQG